MRQDRHELTTLRANKVLAVFVPDDGVFLVGSRDDDLSVFDSNFLRRFESVDVRLREVLRRPKLTTFCCFFTLI